MIASFFATSPPREHALVLKLDAHLGPSRISLSLAGILGTRNSLYVDVECLTQYANVSLKMRYNTTMCLINLYYVFTSSLNISESSIFGYLINSQHACVCSRVKCVRVESCLVFTMSPQACNILLRLFSPLTRLRILPLACCAASPSFSESLLCSFHCCCTFQAQFANEP